MYKKVLLYNSIYLTLCYKSDVMKKSNNYEKNNVRMKKKKQ